MLTLLLAVGCAERETLETKHKHMMFDVTNAYDLSVTADNAVNRAAPVSALSSDFGVMVYDKTGTPLYENIQVSPSGIPASSCYWPPADLLPLSFKAWYPYAYNASVYPDTYTHTLPLDGSNNLNLSTNTEPVLYASTSGTANPISIQFQHILAGLSFSTQSVASGHTNTGMPNGTISSIAITGVYKKGTYNASTGSWTLADGDKTTIKIPIGMAVDNTTSKVLTTANGATTAMLIPQSLAGSTITINYSNGGTLTQTIPSGITLTAGQTTTLYIGNTIPVANYTFKGEVETYTVPLTGTYQLQVWGAQGGGYSTYIGGKGGYSYGTIKLTQGDKLYVCVGNISNTYYSDEEKEVLSATVAGRNKLMLLEGYNGAEASYQKKNAEGVYLPLSSNGGGATHIALNANYGILANYKSGTRRNSILLVAGGGGGADCYTPGGYGGGETGGVSGGSNGTPIPTGGTQTAGGTTSHLPAQSTWTQEFSANGDFGSGGYNACYYTSKSEWDGGGKGGGGWYGGGGSANNGCGGGGSGHVGTGVTGATIAGNQSFEAPNGGKETGHSGNGYARITFVSAN